MGLAAVALGLGAVIPPLVSLVKNSNWSTQQKRIVAILAAVVTGAVSVAVAEGWGDLDLTAWEGGWETIVASTGLVYVSSQAAFKGFWEGTGVDKAAASAIYNN